MKTLQIALGSQTDIRDAFAEHGDVIYYDWTTQKAQYFNHQIRSLVDIHKPDLVFLQLQTPGVISVDTAMYIAQRSKVVNWTGDVRYPTPDWFVQIGRHINNTLFTNMFDVEVLRSKGIKSDYLQIGFPTGIFKPQGEKRHEADIVFMGNNNGAFPLSPLRAQMVEMLTARYGSRFKCFGVNWKGYGPEWNQEEEAKIYRGAKIAINLSHFNYSRYSSDRLFRLMGTGVFCLSHSYPEIEKEFNVGEHLQTWENLEDLVQKIDYYLEHEQQAYTIGQLGAHHVHTNHTWSNRINQLITMI